MRVATWNLRHLALEGADARAFWPGEGDDEHCLLARTFGKALLDLGLDAVVLVEWSPAGEKPADLLEVLEAWLDEKSGAESELAASSIVYDDPANPVANLQFAFAWNRAHRARSREGHAARGASSAQRRQHEAPARALASAGPSW